MDSPRPKGSLRIGTSGWHYDHWRGPFYPAAISARDMLKDYAERFDTVELNSTFYRMPTKAAIARWLAETPADFRFAAKASRFTTHAKRLTGTPESFLKYFAAVEPLRSRMGPIVFQLPPRFAFDIERLRIFIQALPPGYLYAFEFRDPRWFVKATRSLLERQGIALCIYEIGGMVSPLWRTADFVYVRLHGPGLKYQGEYGAQGLAPWARRIRTWMAEGRDVWCYFDNDQSGYAAKDAMRLKRMLGQSLVDRAAPE